MTEMPTVVLMPWAHDTNFHEAADALPQEAVRPVLDQVLGQVDRVVQDTEPPVEHPMDVAWHGFPGALCSYGVALAIRAGDDLSRRRLVQMQYLAARCAPSPSNKLPSWWGSRNLHDESAFLISERYPDWTPPEYEMVSDDTRKPSSQLLGRSPVDYKARPDPDEFECTCAVAAFEDVGSDGMSWYRCKGCLRTVPVWASVTLVGLPHRFADGPLGSDREYTVDQVLSLAQDGSLSSYGCSPTVGQDPSDLFLGSSEYVWETSHKGL